MKTLQASAALISIVTSVTGLANDSLPQRKLKTIIAKEPARRSQEGPVAALKSPITTATATATATRRQKRPRKVIRAPLVDSQLLRFVGTQRERLQLQEQRNTKASAGIIREQSSLEHSLETIGDDGEKYTASGRRYVDSDDSDVAAISSQTSQQSSALDSSGNNILQLPSSTFGQFNCHRVALVLQNHEADAELALQVGERIQAHALSRTTRRRIRAFLKERDIIWRTSMAASPSMPDESAADIVTQQQLESRIMDRMSSRPNKNTYLESLTPSPADKPTMPENSFQEAVELMLSRGLTIKDVCEILFHSPGIALMRPRLRRDINDDESGETLQETLDRTLHLLLDTLALRKYDARKVLRNTPGLLSLRGSKQAEQLVLVMSVSLGVSTSSLARDKNALSVLLSRAPAAMFRFIAFLSSDVVRMPMDKIGPLIRRDECQSVLDQVAPVTEVIIEQSLDQDPCVISALWDRRRATQLRRERINGIYKRMSSTAQMLRDEIGTDDLGKVIAAYPEVLLLDAETEIMPAADYLMKQLGIYEDDLPRVLQSFPALLGLGKDGMSTVAEFLLSLEVQEESLGNILRSFPALLTLSVDDNIKPVVAFLRETVGISNIGRFVTRLPPVLGYSVERELQPKWDFLQRISVDAAFEASRFPAYFSYPLERVIKTRYEYLARIKKLPPSMLPLDSVLRYGDRDFAVKIVRDTDGGKAFRAFCDKRRRMNQPKSKKATQKTPLKVSPSAT